MNDNIIEAQDTVVTEAGVELPTGVVAQQYFQVPIETAQAVINFLAQCPYNNVVGLIDAFKAGKLI